MVAMSYNELTASVRAGLLLLARKVVEQGCITGSQLKLDSALEQQSLHPLLLNSILFEPGCCFVSLHQGRHLRGCIGALEPYQSLLDDIISHAYDAAFNDPRFPAVVEDELSKLTFEISILSVQEKIECSTEAELLQQLVPFKDGLILEEGERRATYLPSVWHSLKDKQEFIQQLKLKAGLEKDYWSETIKAYRYQTIGFSE